jgi:predicted Zn-dependent protease|tara:strand:- start:2086 stop:2409 length:324 start_codon:yes stop_codon:yes gene_type:complete
VLIVKRAHLDRQSELHADKDSIFMVANSGFQKDSCKRFLHFMSKSTGYVTTQDPENTHPSDEQRFAHAEKVTEEYKASARPTNNEARGWRYNKLDNYLLLIPTAQED